MNAGKLRVIYALPDNSTITNVKISAFLDGKQVTSINLNKGEADTLELDTSGAKSYAINIDSGISDGVTQDRLYAVQE